MTGIEKLRAQVEGGTTPNLVVPRALMRDILHEIERDCASCECAMKRECGGVKFGYEAPAYCHHSYRN